MPLTATQRTAIALKAHATRRRNLELAKRPKVKVKPIPQVAIKMPKPAAMASAKDMMLKTVVLVLTINGIGNRRKVDPNSINITDAHTEEDVNKDWLGITRKLMEAPELKAIQSIGNKAKAYVMTRALPSQIKMGVYLLPKEFDEETDTKLKGFIAEMQPHIESLAQNLPKYKKEAKAQQGPQFNEEQFPTAAEIRASFKITWRYLFVDSAQGLSKKLAEEERKKAEAAWAETTEVIQKMLRAQFLEKLNHFIERLTPGEYGKYRMFTESSVDKFHDWIDTFSPKNLTGDAELATLVAHAKSVFKNANGEMLRSDDQFREYVRTGFENIKEILDPLVVDKPHRALKLAD